MEKIIRTITDTLIEVSEVIPDGDTALIRPLAPVLVKNTKVLRPSAMRYVQKEYPGKTLMLGKINHTSEMYEMSIDTFMQYATKKEM